MKKKYGKNRSASRSDNQRRKLLALLIGVLVVVGGIGIALSAAQNSIDNPPELTEEQAQYADTVAASGGTNKELSVSTAAIGQTGATLYNSDAFLQTGLTPNDLAEPLEQWVESSFANLNGLQVRFTGVTQGTSNAESVIWFDTNNTEHTYLRGVHNGNSLTFSSVSKEVYDEATKNMYKSNASATDAQALDVLSRVQFFDMTNCPVSPEEIAVSFDSFNTSGNLGIKSISYVQCSGSTGGINMWFTTDNENCKYVLCQLKAGASSWGQVENLGNLNLDQAAAVEQAVGEQAEQAASAE